MPGHLLAANMDTVAVVAFPVTAEKAFLGLADRVLGAEPKDLGNGLYALPALEPGHKARLRFADQYEYVAYGVSPEPALDATVRLAADLSTPVDVVDLDRAGLELRGRVAERGRHGTIALPAPAT